MVPLTNSESPTRIAIVAGHFMPEVGYQEVYLAHSFARLGHQVCVFTSDRVSQSSRKIVKGKYPTGENIDKVPNLTIKRYQAFAEFRSAVFAGPILHDVDKFDPELIIIIGVGKLFGLDILNPVTTLNKKIISIFSDNSDQINRTTLKKRILRFIQEIGFGLFKRPAYQKAAKYSQKLIFNMPDGVELALKHISKPSRADAKKKSLVLHLGYDSTKFFYSDDERERVRGEYGIAEGELVFTTVTRIVPGKRVEELIEAISQLYTKYGNIRYFLAGFLGDQYEDQIRKVIGDLGLNGIIIPLPFLKKDDNRALYNASDIGIWQQSAISTVESMGTGLPVVLENKPSVSHLVHLGTNGWLWQPGEMNSKLEEVAKSYFSNQHLLSRRNVASFNYTHFSYDAIARKIIEQVKINE